MEKIKELNDFESVGSYLGIGKKELKKLAIYHGNSNYTRTHIRKKNGERRYLYIPNEDLKKVQQKVKILIENEFNPSKYAFAYKKNSSIIDNAKPHANKNFVIHLDIKNFFPSINFARVRNMFIRYFHAKAKVATTLANLCCVHVNNDFFLPQGACTSSLISNVIAKTLDKEIVQFLKEVNLLNWNYTRYADDITISTDSEYFKEINLVSEIKKIIEANGFEVNEAKTRTEKNTVRQSVTGIIVNEGLNISKKYRKNIKSFLHGFEVAHKNNVDEEMIFQKFWATYKRRNKTYTPEKVTPFDILSGMINFVGDVKGRGNSEFISMAKRFNNLLVLFNVDKKPIKYNPNQFSKVELSTFVVDIGAEIIEYIDKTGNKEVIGYGQGTGFILNGHGFITNYHVLEDTLEKMEKNLNGISYRDIVTHRKRIAMKNQDISFKAKNPRTNNSLILTVKQYNKDEDWVLLDIKKGQTSGIGLDAIKHSLTSGMNISCWGYPEYFSGDVIRGQNGTLGVPHNKMWTVEKINIVQGNSGGPVLNRKGQVIGIASRGSNSNSTVQSQIIPISTILKSIKKER